MPLDKKEVHFFTRMALQTHFCIKITKALLIKTQEKKECRDLWILASLELQ